MILIMLYTQMYKVLSQIHKETQACEQVGQTNRTYHMLISQEF